jgi:hypothetical protein
MSPADSLQARNRKTIRVLLAIMVTLAVATLVRGIVW